MSMHLPPDAKILVREWAGEREWLAARTDDYLSCSLGAGVPPLVAVRSAAYVQQQPARASAWRPRVAAENAQAKQAWTAIQRWCLARGESTPRETDWPTP
jgi:hypothetical protein